MLNDRISDGITLMIFLQIILINIRSTLCVHGLILNANRYAFKLIHTLHSCDNELLVVASKGQIGCPNFLKRLEISYIPAEAFLQVGFNSFDERVPKCIVILPVSSENQNYDRGLDIQNFIKKVESELDLLSIYQSKPTIIFIWPEVLFHCKNKKQEQLEKLERVFRNSKFKLNSDIYILFISYHSVSGFFTSSIWETYSIKKLQIFQKLVNPPDHEVLMGVDKKFKSGLDYEEDEGTHYDDLTNKVERRADFMGEIIVASTRDDVSQADWMSLKVDGNKLSLEGGSSAFLYWDLQKTLNFTQGLVIGDSLITLANNSLAGKTVEQINTGEADISLSQSLIVEFRAKEFTFLQPTYFGIIHVFFQQPSANSIRNIVTAPFETSLWLTFIGTWLYLVVVVKISFYVKNWFGYGRILHDNDTIFSSEIAMWAIAVNCQKSWPIIPPSTATKIVFIVGSLCSVVTYVAYSAAIVSSLAVTIVPVGQFLDLINFKFMFTVHQSSEPFQDFLHRMIETYRLPQEVVTVSTEKEISHLLNPLKPRAFLTYPDLFYQTAVQLNYSETFICQNVWKVRVSDVPYKSGMFVKKGSQYTEMFNHKLMKIKERGFNFRYMQEYERKNVFSCVTHIGKARVIPVMFSDVFTAFLVVFIGLIVALASILFEIMLHKYKNINGRRSNGTFEFGIGIGNESLKP